MSPIAVSTPPPTAVLPPALVRTAAGAPAGWQGYAVRAGDTLADIAQRHHTTPGVLAAQNHLPNGGRIIQVGSVILVPGQATAAAPAAPTRAASVSFGSYTVKRGDTVSQIALRSTATARQIMAANGLGPRSHITPGQVLRIPGAAPAAPAAPTKAAQAAARSARSTPATGRTAAYGVARGDTVEGIARRSRVSQTSLIKANGLRSPYLIQVGQILQVPSSAPDPTGNTFAGRTYPQATVSAAATARSTLQRAHLPGRQAMRSIIESTARRNGVDPRLALAIAYQESGWDQGQVSVANAIGAMQIIPSSGQWASSLAGRRLDLLKPEDNATAGVVILRALTHASRSLDEAIAGYYQGLSSVRSQGMYADTRQYVATVKALMTRV